MTARGAANVLTRTTAILAAAFFVTSLALGIMARYGERPIDILDRAPAAPAGQQQVPGGQGGVLDQLGGTGSAQPAPPQGQAAPDAAAPADGAVPIAPLEPITPAPQGDAAPAQPAAPTVPSGQ